MFQFKFSYVAFAAALASTSVFADPSSYTHLSGTKVIDIEAPNAAGVSHNLYREFDVSSKGVILNNSGVDSTTSSVGNLAKNNNLVNGSASVILNEVISNKASKLNGFIEVNGQKADVVIANPNGITCSGCSFVNTNKAVLTTGKVNLSSTGAISSYDVTKGTITVDEKGMNAANNYALLMADAIKINGTINAQNAIISAGNFTFDNATGGITSAGKTASLLQTLIPEYSIDISSLGGVKANSITMVGNNLGFGVRNKGAVVANGSLTMASNGALMNEGAVTGNGYVTQLVTLGEMTNKGTIATKGITMVTSQNKLTNQGTMDTASQMAISAAGNIENSGVIKSVNTLVVNTNGNLENKSVAYLQSKNQLSITAQGNVTLDGLTEGKNTTINFGGNEMKVTKNLYGYDTLQIQSWKNNALSSGVITTAATADISSKNVTVKTKGDITHSGKIQGNNIAVTTDGLLKLTADSVLKANNSVMAKSYTLDNTGFLGGEYANVFVDNWKTVNAGHIVGRDLRTLTWYDLENNEGGLIRGHNTLTIDTQKNGNIINRGLIKADNAMNMTAKQVINGGYKCGFMNLKTCGAGTIEANKLVLNSTHKYASEMGGNQKIKAIEVKTFK